MTDTRHTVQLSHLEQTIYFASQRQGRSLLDADIVANIAQVSREHATKLLFSMARKGALYRLGRGRYAVIPPDVLYDRKSYVIDPYMIVDELMGSLGEGESYYVAYQSAAALHGAAHQLPFSLLVAVPQQRRPIDLGQARIQCVQLMPNKFFGFQQLRYHDVFLNVSDEAKTVLDCLERFDLCGGVEEVARTISALTERIDSGKLLEYLRQMGNQALTQRLGLILERLSSVQRIEKSVIEGISQLVGKHVYSMDPHGPDSGQLVGRWQIRENIDILKDI